MRHDRAALWRVIYIARGEQQAFEIETLLTAAGFMVDREHPSSDTGREDIEINVLESEAEEARLYLMEMGY